MPPGARRTTPVVQKDERWRARSLLFRMQLYTVRGYHHDSDPL
jgi:hypothetical protein